MRTSSRMLQCFFTCKLHLDFDTVPTISCQAPAVQRYCMLFCVNLGVWSYYSVLIFLNSGFPVVPSSPRTFQVQEPTFCLHSTNPLFFFFPSFHLHIRFTSGGHLLLHGDRTPVQLASSPVTCYDSSFRQLTLFLSLHSPLIPPRRSNALVY